MNKIIRFTLALVLAFSLSGCAGGGEAMALDFRLPIALDDPTRTVQSPLAFDWDPEEKFAGVPFKYRVYGDLNGVVMRVVDGDTLYARITDVHPVIGYEIGIRVYGIDTRELDDGGDGSKAVAKELLPPGTKVKLRNIRRGKYFRLVADVLFVLKDDDGKKTVVSLADYLLERDLAYPYFGGTKRPKGWKPDDYEDPLGTTGAPTDAPDGDE